MELALFFASLVIMLSILSFGVVGLSKRIEESLKKAEEIKKEIEDQKNKLKDVRRTTEKAWNQIFEANKQAAESAKQAVKKLDRVGKDLALRYDLVKGVYEDIFKTLPELEEKTWSGVITYVEGLAKELKEQTKRFTEDIEKYGTGMLEEANKIHNMLEGVKSVFEKYGVEVPESLREMLDEMEHMEKYLKKARSGKERYLEGLKNEITGQGKPLAGEEGEKIEYRLLDDEKSNVSEFFEEIDRYSAMDTSSVEKKTLEEAGKPLSEPTQVKTYKEPKITPEHVENLLREADRYKKNVKSWTRSMEAYHEFFPNEDVRELIGVYHELGECIRHLRGRSNIDLEKLESAREEIGRVLDKYIEVAREIAEGHTYKNNR